MMLKTVHNKLIIDGEIVARFPYPIARDKQVQDTIVMFLAIPRGVLFPLNVFGYVLSEKRLWQIDKYYLNEPCQDSQVTYICRIDIPGQVVLWTRMRLVLYVDVATGKVLKTLQL